VSAEFLTVEQAAELLNLAPNSVIAAIDAGRIRAMRLGETHRATRIPRSELFPADDSATDLRTRRLRKLVAGASSKRETADRMRAAWLEAEREADEALRAIEHELALDELESAVQRQKSASAAD
jgi:excisionase family DNA binding protein